MSNERWIAMIAVFLIGIAAAVGLPYCDYSDPVVGTCTI